MQGGGYPHRPQPLGAAALNAAHRPLPHVILMQVAAGGRHTLALANDNTLWAFGNNESGQLAAPLSTAQATPQVVQGLPRGCPILFVAAGGDHSVTVVDRHASLEAGAVGKPLDLGFRAVACVAGGAACMLLLLSLEG